MLDAIPTGFAKKPRTPCRCTLSALVALLLCALPAAAAELVIHHDWGPFYTQYLDAESRPQTKILGPLYQHTELPKEKSATALRPFWSRLDDPTNAYRRSDWLFPMGSVTDMGREHKWRFLSAFRWVYERDNPESPRKLWVLPFWFQGISRTGEPYIALFPIGGTLREFLSRDRIDFALWPIWTSSRFKQQQTTSWLWPFFSSTTSPTVERKRWFPLYGVSRKTDGTMTSRFILWPFWSESTHILPNGTAKGFIFFPFYGRTESPSGTTRWYAPPFFRFSDDSRDRREHALWPIWQQQTGEINKHYIFPLYGWQERAHVKRWFYLWPIARHHRVDRGDYVLRRTIILPFFYHYTRKDTVQPPPPPENSPPCEKLPPRIHDEIADRYLEIWPLFSWERSGDRRHFRMVELWPGRDPDPVTRNWSPLWSPVRYHASGDNSDTEILWGFFRHFRRGEHTSHTSLFPFFERTSNETTASSRWSVGKGLLARSTTSENSSWQVLWFVKLGGESP